MSHHSDQSEIQTLLDSFENSKSCNSHDKQRIIDILNELERRDKFGGYNRWFVPGTPYGIENLPKHRAFFEAGATYDERFFCAGNRCGKTLAGAYEMACHLTGEYPSWWRGREFDHAIAAWACGKTSKVTRDSVQKELLGEDGIGSGMIPRDKIIKVWAKPGTPRGIETVEIRHISGGTSSLTFKSYEEGVQSFYGTARHVLWMDEEADEYIYSECFLRTATTGGLIYTTFTPKHGITPFVLSFFKNADFLAGSPKILFTEQEMNDG